ncbi:MAG TPA: hypothetical protein VKB23_05720 [Solirubrobacterales bacterium]|nr:hypothetical protein [Solirubrobacterales bacterium]
MDRLKMLGLIALAATAVMAFAATASATTATSPKGTVYTSTVTASTEGHAILHDKSGLGITPECNGTLAGSIAEDGVGKAIGIKVTTLGWSNCTNNWALTTLKAGLVQIHSVSGSENGTVTSTGLEVTGKQSTTGLHCIWSTNVTDIGFLTSSTSTGGNATIDMSGTLKRTGGSSGIFCGEEASWTGSYKITTPTTFYVDA